MGAGKGTGVDSLVKTMLDSSGKGHAYRAKLKGGDRIVYSAVVTAVEDKADQNRIKARIVSVDNGKISGIENADESTLQNAGGRDAFVRDNEQLPWCLPLVPEFLHVRPKVGEMVWIITENPKKITSPRYWIGPVITSKYHLTKQNYLDAYKIGLNSTHIPNPVSNEDNTDSKRAFPAKDDIAIQGRKDADLILKDRELLLIAGKFKTTSTNAESYSINTETPCFLNLIQKINPEATKNAQDQRGKVQNEAVEGTGGSEKELNENESGELLEKFSEARLQSTNVNIFSPRGKYRNSGEMSKYEINKDLKSFDELSNSLHPAVFGDELVKLLDIIVQIILTHIHTPQKPLASTGLSEELGKYTVKGDLQKLISYHIRIN